MRLGLGQGSQSFAAAVQCGLGSGFAAVVAYSVFEASLCGGFAFFLQAKLSQIGQATGLNWLGYIQWPWLMYE